MSAGYRAYRAYMRVMEPRWPDERCQAVWAMVGEEHDKWREGWEAAARANGSIEVSTTSKPPAQVDFLKLNASASGK